MIRVNALKAIQDLDTALSITEPYEGWLDLYSGIAKTGNTSASLLHNDIRRAYPTEVLQELELVQHDNLRVELIPKKSTTDLAFVKAERVVATKANIYGILSQYKVDTEDNYRIYRNLITTLVPRKIKIDISREDDTISLRFKHMNYYDMFKQFKEKSLVALREEAKNSGFLETLLSNENFMRQTTFDSTDMLGYSTIEISSPLLNSKYEYTNTTVSINSYEELIFGSTDLADFFMGEPESTDSPISYSTYLESVIEEIIMNIVLHYYDVNYVTICLFYHTPTEKFYPIYVMDEADKRAVLVQNANPNITVGTGVVAF